MKYGPFVAFYGLQFQEAIQVDIMLKYTAIKSGSYDVMVVYATDGLNKDANLTILEDDKSFFPEYNGVLTVRDGLFETSPTGRGAGADSGAAHRPIHQRGHE